MSATKLSDLLPIPPGTRQPHPYQVLGLEDGEQDMAKINSALESIVNRLKTAKENTDPDLWKRAARLVKGAQEVLANSDKKAQLDARFGIVSIDSEDQPSGDSNTDALAAFLPNANPLSAQEKSQDPLAAVLPTANPLAPSDNNPIEAALTSQPSETTSRTVSEPVVIADSVTDSSDVNAMPPGLFGTPSVARSGGTSKATSSVVVSKPQRHRKRSTTGTLLFVTFAFAAFGVIGALAYFIFFGSGPIAVTRDDGKITISTAPQETQPKTVVAKPRPVAPDPKERPVDPVMGGLRIGDSSNGKKGRPSGLTSDGPDGNDPSNGERSMVPIDLSLEAMTPTGEAIAQSSIVEGIGENGNMRTESMTEMQPGMQPENEPLTDAMIASADEELAKIGQLIRAANWSKMKSAAEAIFEKKLSQEQQTEAQSLFELADLATYYRVGIEKAIADLNIGNDFEISNDFRVIIVQKGPDELVIRFNARNKSYSFDELPLPLAHRLATFQMPDTPTAEAAKAAYQAVVPNTTDSFRNQAIEWLGEIEGEVEGADPSGLAETIRKLFGEPSQ